MTVASDSDEEEDSETPSFWRGAVAKPLLLAGLGGATFFVNHWFKTSTATSRPTQPQTSKQKYVPATVQKRTVAAPHVPNSKANLPKIQGFSN